MKIALAQIDIKAGQPSINFNNMKQKIIEAKKQQAELIVFPEMSVSGYLLGDKYLDDHFMETCVEYNEQIKQLSTDIGIIWGNVSLAEFVGRDGRKARHNCAYFAYNQQWVKRENQTENAYVKYLNPDYRGFDESRYFYSAIELALRENKKLEENASLFLFKNQRIGIEVCEDLWSENYNFNPTQHYAKQNADFIVNISCSPWTKNKEQARHNQVKRHAKNNDLVPLVYVSGVGMQNNGKNVFVFDGDSTIYNATGEVMSQCNDSFEEELLISELAVPHQAKRCENKLLKALIKAIQAFDEQVFNKRFKWMIGLSGGLDSSVNAALLVIALGNKRVLGLNMVTRYNSSQTIDNAHKLAKALNMEIRDGAIQTLVEAQIECLKQYTDQPISDFAIENIQARIRGSVLGGISAVENGVIINNGNKVEGALGYATLYGDTIGCLAPLQDLTKVELFELSHIINQTLNKEVIPTNLLPEISEEGIKWITPPSAELKNNQLDPMKWYYHDYLIQMITEYPSYQIENVMQAYLDRSIFDTEIGKWIKYYHLDEPKAFIEDLEWILNKVELGVFKRIQSAPIVILSKTAFGNDFRENQCRYERSNRYNQLKEAILNAHQ